MDNSVREPIERVFSKAVEDYLKAIYKLEQASGAVSTTDLARRLRTSPAAVSKMLRHLAGMKMVDHTRYYGVRLTEAGRSVALEVIRHHRLLELYLHKALGYSWDEVDAEADNLEHHISEEFEDRIDRMLDYPSHDPHGDPIPTRDGKVATVADRPLGTSEAGERLVVRRVRDESAEMLRYLSGLGLGIDSVLEVTDVQPFNGPITLRIGEDIRSIGREAADHVFVERHEE